jgi:hypothetical protein
MNKIANLFFFLLLYNLGFSQSYLGAITKQVNFRQGPGGDYEIISSLKPGTQVFISSLETENDYYNVIDIATNKDGFVKKSFVRVGKLVSRSTESVFTPDGQSSDYKPEVKIYNNTSKTLTLKMNAELFYFSPYETKNISLYPGEYDFRASAPGVIPYIGTENLNGNQSYSCNFILKIEGDNFSISFLNFQGDNRHKKWFSNTFKIIVLILNNLVIFNQKFIF